VNGSATTRKKKEARPRANLPEHLTRLLLLTYHWRYVTAPILRRCFPAHYPGVTDRTARHHLSTLELLGFLKSTRPTLNDPRIYSTSAKARRHLAAAYPQHRFYNTREETERPDRLSHELAISDFQTELLTTIESRPDLTLIFTERRYFHAANRLAYVDPDGQPTRLEPDLGFLLRVSKAAGSYLLHYFVELDQGTESTVAFRSKLAGYAAWHRQQGSEYLTGLYRRHGDPNPTAHLRLCVVTRARRSGGSDADQLDRLLGQTDALPSVLRRSTYFTSNQRWTAQRLPLTARIWHPAWPGRTAAYTLLPPAE
jgi:hypothetical protein